MSNLIAEYIKSNPRAIKDTWVGKLTDRILRLEPNSYNTEGYAERLQKSKRRPIRIVFSGMHDNEGVKYAQQALNKKYGQSTIYVFGYDQLDEALRFASGLEKDRPVTVYGYSWGGGDAQRFINAYKGNIVGAHFMDPVRKDLDEKKVMHINKDIPVTFTGAMPYKSGFINDIKEATIDNLRFAPSKKFQILPTAKSHSSVDEMVNKTYKYEQEKKKQQLLEKVAGLGDYIRNNALDIQKSTIGKAILGFANWLPADYDTSNYKAKLENEDEEQKKKPVKIFFSGLPDSEMVGFARKALQKKYGPGSVFIFGHKQLPQAIEFASHLDPQRPVTVYGFSWGSTAARDFADMYKGNLQGVHFFDPMRKTPSVDPHLKIKKEVPVTFTAADTAQRGPIDAAQLDVLRWMPDKKFKVLKTVSDHLALDEMLNGLPKAASHTPIKKTWMEQLINDPRIA